MQKAKVDQGAIKTALNIWRNEGTVFYRGFTTYYVRIAPHAMITLLAADYLRILSGKLDIK
jgi:solute carrier family 25 (mitochondrial oxoglutarate transporter), member 11